MADTVTVRRGGSYLTIPALAVERYMAKGYDVVDNAGNIVQSGTPNDINILKRAYEQHVEEIKKLKEEIAQLKAQPKAEPVKHSKLFGTEVEEPKIEEEPVEKKTTSRRSKKSV
jgi:hypothetical protein